VRNEQWHIALRSRESQGAVEWSDDELADGVNLIKCPLDRGSPTYAEVERDCLGKRTLSHLGACAADPHHAIQRNVLFTKGYDFARIQLRRREVICRACAKLDQRRFPSSLARPRRSGAGRGRGHWIRLTPSANSSRTIPPHPSSRLPQPMCACHRTAKRGSDGHRRWSNARHDLRMIRIYSALGVR